MIYILFLEGDSKILVDYLLRQCLMHWQIRIVCTYMDFLNLTSDFSSISFHHNFRGINFSTDAITNLWHQQASDCQLLMTIEFTI